jgi:hypothetical protein
MERMKKALLLLALLIATPCQAETLRKCTTLMDASAQTASTNGSVVEFLPFKVESMSAILTALNNSGTTPTLDAKIQSCRTTDPASCYDWYTFTGCTTGACKPSPVDVNRNNTNWFRFFRVVTTLGGTSPNYNVKVELCYY